MQSLVYLFPAAAVLLVACSLSLLVKSEALRGAGRVAGGIGLILFGCFMAILFYNLTQQVFLFWSACAVIVSGALHLASGARKFVRRHQAS